MLRLNTSFSPTVLLNRFHTYLCEMSVSHRMFTPVLDLSEIKNIGDNASVTSVNLDNINVDNRLKSWEAVWRDSESLMNESG